MKLQIGRAVAMVIGGVTGLGRGFMEKLLAIGTFLQYICDSRNSLRVSAVYCDVFSFRCLLANR